MSYLKLIEHTETGESYKHISACSYSVTPTIKNSAQEFNSTF